jgi:hypothetical protein
VSITVDQTWIYRFHDQLLLTYQQKGSLLTNTIDGSMVHRDVHAAVDHHERLGNVLANDVVSPFGQTKILNPEHSRRAVNLVSSDAAVLVSDENTLRAMVNPQNGYTTTIVYALGRRADKHIIDASTGTATTAVVGPNSAQITQGAQALPAGRIIRPTTFFTPPPTTDDMSLATIIAAASLLSKAGVPNGMSERFALYSPGQLTDLMAITQASSSDFTKNQIHDRGTINGLSWEGFNWIEIADVVAPDASTVLGTMLNFNPTVPTLRRCIFFHRGAVGLSVARDITTKINERPDLNNSIQVRSLMMQAAVRVWEGGVVAADVTEK